MLSKLVNAVLFKVNWLACVLGGPIWGALGIALLGVFSVWSGKWRRDWPLAVTLAVTGFALDTAWIALGVLDYGMPFAPLWIVFLWIGLALTLNHAMSVFQEHVALGALLCGTAAPVTYLSGEMLGAVVVINPPLLSTIAIAWAGLFYGLFRYLAGRREVIPAEVESRSIGTGATST